MSETDAAEDGEIGASPTQISNPRLRYEAYRAAVWVGVGSFIARWCSCV